MNVQMKARRNYKPASLCFHILVPPSALDAVRASRPKLFNSDRARPRGERAIRRDRRRCIFFIARPDVSFGVSLGEFLAPVFDRMRRHIRSEELKLKRLDRVRRARGTVGPRSAEF